MNSSSPLVSIIIPTYNRAHLIGETLESVLAQTYTNWECIIVDDGSTDDTETLIQNYISKDNRFRYYKRPENRLKGPGACRNYGFEKCEGDYIHFMDSDDLYFDYSLEKYMNMTNEMTDVVVAQIETIDFYTNSSHGSNNLKYNDLISDFFTGEVVFYTSGPFWNKIFLNKQAVLFDEKITRLDDWEFNIRMLLEKPSIAYLNSPLIKYRKHHNSLNNEVSKFNIKEIESHIYAKKKIYKRIKRENILNTINFNEHIGEFYKQLYKNSLLAKDPIRHDMFKKSLNNLLKRKELSSIFFLLLSQFTFEVFGKGYKFLKYI